MGLRLLDTTSPPLLDAITGPKGLLSATWSRWFGRLPATLGAIPSILNVVTLSGQNASIVATDFSGTSLLPGVYLVIYHARITQAATVSSSLTVTLTWTEGGVVQSYVGPAITGNTTASYQVAPLLIRSDGGTAVTYATTYVSVGGTVMLYSLDLTILKIQERT